MRVLSALFLSLVLALASVSMAVARGQVPVGGTIALCLDGAAVTVSLDADGNPVTTPPHLCPDCLSAATAFDLPQTVDLPTPIRREMQVVAGQAVERSYIRAVFAPLARGPPVLSV